MNTDKNSYTIIYATIMVVVAAVLLAGASVLLKEKQLENERIDKMEQILRSIGIQTEDNAKVAGLYAQNIKQAIIIDADGAEKEVFSGDQLATPEDKVFNNNLSEGEYPLYQAEISGQQAYIIPLNGAGLWGPIWGYIAIDANDCSSVLGIDLGNASETPGLGAEMSAQFFQERFRGKQLFEGDEYKGISIVKPNTVQPSAYTVDGLTGGTITSNGVHDMLDKSIRPYRIYLQNKKGN